MKFNGISKCFRYAHKALMSIVHLRVMNKRKGKIIERKKKREEAGGLELLLLIYIEQH